MLIGQDRAGKTSLKKSFLGLPFDPYEQSTDGIEVDPSKFEIDVGQVKNWQQTEEKLSVSQFANDLAKMVAAQFGDEGTSVTPEVQDELKKTASQTNEISFREETTPKAAKVQEVHTIHHNQKAAGESALPALNFDPTLPPEEFTRLLNQHLEGLHLQRDTTSTENHMTLDLWDFAGQHLYYASYPVFLSSRAIYMLVYNLSKELKNTAQPYARLGSADIPLENPSGETNLDNLVSWLGSISTLCSSKRMDDSRQPENVLPYLRPPVFIVGTHADRPCQDIGKMESEIQGALFGKEVDGHVIRAFFRIDNTKGSSDVGVRALQKLMIEVLKQEPYMGEEVPLRWFNFEKVIQALVAKEMYYLSLQQLQTVIQEVCFIDNENEVATMLDFYHDLGIIVKHGSTVVLQAQWLIDLFRQLITIRRYNDMESRHSTLWKQMEEKGILSMELVDHVFSKYCEQGFIKEDILGMMEKFGLIVKFESSLTDVTYFTPSQLKKPSARLSKMEPSPSDPCPLYIRFPAGLVPHGLYSHLVARCIKWCSDSGIVREPVLRHMISSFTIKKEEAYHLILFCQKMSIRVILKQSQPDKEAPLAEKEEVATLMRNFLEEALELSRELSCWGNLKYEFCVACPYCPEEEEPCTKHRQVSCTHEDCICFLKVQQGGELGCCQHSGEIPTIPSLRKWFSKKGGSEDKEMGAPAKKRESSRPSPECIKRRKLSDDPAKQSLRDVEQLQRYPRNTTRMTDVSRRLDEISSDKGFTVSDNEGSGNCMFYSLSEQLDLVKGIQISHDALRQHIVQYLEKNPTLSDGTKLFNFVHGYQSWSDYLTKMSADGTWGDHVILHAVSNCYETCIHVISSLSPNHDVTISPEQKCDVESSNRLVLGHLHEHHYVSLRPKPGSSRDEDMPTPTSKRGSSCPSPGQHFKRLLDNTGLVKEGCPPDDELERLSMNLEEWRPLGRRLDFNNAQLTGFDKDTELWREKAFAMLMAWKQREGKYATYRVLFQALRHEFVNRKDLAEKICCHSD